MAEWVIEANDTEEAAEGKFAFIRELVRCKDCEHYIRHDKRCGLLNHGVKTDFFCKWGERKVDDFCSHGERREDDE